MEYHIQFLNLISLFQKRRLSYAISRISFISPKLWTIICTLLNFILFSKIVDYHMQFLEFPSLIHKTWFITCNYCKVISLLQKLGLSLHFVKFLSLLHKSGLFYAIFKNSFSFAKNED